MPIDSGKFQKDTTDTNENRFRLQMIQSGTESKILVYYHFGFDSNPGDTPHTLQQILASSDLDKKCSALHSDPYL
jgi:hypothetical protein